MQTLVTTEHCSTCAIDWQALGIHVCGEGDPRGCPIIEGLPDGDALAPCATWPLCAFQGDGADRVRSLCESCTGEGDTCPLAYEIGGLTDLGDILAAARAAGVLCRKCEAPTRATIRAFWLGYVANRGLTLSELEAFDAALCGFPSEYGGAWGFNNPEMATYPWGISAFWKWARKHGGVSREDRGRERVRFYPEQLAWVVDRFQDHIPPYMLPLAMLQRPLSEYLEPVPQGEAFPDPSTIYVKPYMGGDDTWLLSGEGVLRAWGTVSDGWKDHISRRMDWQREQWRKVAQVCEDKLAKGQFTHDSERQCCQDMLERVRGFLLAPYPEYVYTWPDPKDVNSLVAWENDCSSTCQLTPWPEKAVKLALDMPIVQLFRVKPKYVALVWQALSFIARLTPSMFYSHGGAAVAWPQGWPKSARGFDKVWPAIEGETPPGVENSFSPDGWGGGIVGPAPYPWFYPPKGLGNFPFSVYVYVLTKAQDAGPLGVTLRELKQGISPRYRGQVGAMVQEGVRIGQLAPQERKGARGPATMAYVYAD